MSFLILLSFNDCHMPDELPGFASTSTLPQSGISMREKGG